MTLNRDRSMPIFSMTKSLRSKRHRYLWMVSVTVIMAANAVARGQVPAASTPPAAEQATKRPATAKARELSEAFRAAAQNALPSVVTVYAKRAEEDGSAEQGLLELLGEDPSLTHNIGSGVILSPDGLIVTNHHVVDKCNIVRIRLPDGREYLGKDIRSDPGSDLAILTIASPKKLPSITIGDSSNLAVGDWVLAIGSPFAIEQTVSAGIISGKARGMRGLVAGQLLQTDAAINPGNSGGALVNLDGELIGINTAIASTSGEFQGVGFAIPGDRVKWITSELVANGKVRRATIGLQAAALGPDIAEQLDLPLSGGALIVRLREDYPAEKAGLKKGDVIIRIADQAVQNHHDLNAIVEQLPIDKPLPIVVIREGQSLELMVTLQARRE